MICVVCCVVVRHNGKFLFVKEIKQEAQGKFGLPGGQLEPGETLEAAARREFKEETGYELDALQLLTINQKPQTQYGNTVIKFVYEGTNPRRASAGEMETVWLTLKDIEEYASQGLIRGQDVPDLVKYKRGHSAPLTIIVY